MRKQLSLLIFTSLFFAFTGCKDKVDPIVVQSDTGGNVVLGAASASSSTFKLSSNVAWTIESDKSWCKVSPTSGNKSETITVSVLEKSNDVDSRFATITIKSKGIVYEEIIVEQSPVDNVQTVVLGNAWHMINDMKAWEVKDGIISYTIPTNAEITDPDKKDKWIGRELGVDMPAVKTFSVETQVFIDATQVCDMRNRFMIGYANAADVNLDDEYWACLQQYQINNIRAWQIWDPDNNRGGVWSNISIAGLNTNASWHKFKIKWINGEMQYFIDDILIDTNIGTLLVATDKFKDVTELKIKSVFYYGFPYAQNYSSKWTFPVIKYIII